MAADDEPFAWNLQDDDDKPKPADVPTQAVGLPETPATPAAADDGEATEPVAVPTERMPAPRSGSAAGAVRAGRPAHEEADPFTDLGLTGGLVAESAPTEALGWPRESRRRSVREEAAPAATGALVWVAAGLLAVLLLIGLFVLGTRLPTLLAAPVATSPAASETASTAPSASPTAEPTPTPSAPATGPLPPGTHAWDELRGGECLQPYTSPWAEHFTVVECTSPHAGQVVATGPVPGYPSTSAYPGDAIVAAKSTGACTADGVIDLKAAGSITDLQVQASYPANAEQWSEGYRSYWCFASRASGEPMTVSVAPPARAK